MSMANGPSDELAIVLSVAEWLQIRAILTEQVAAFRGQIERNNATVTKINAAISPRFEASKAGPQLVS